MRSIQIRGLRINDERGQMKSCVAERVWSLGSLNLDRGGYLGYPCLKLDTQS